ncbi:MAG: hypothetical protein U0641_15280 [Anaerolineae bacterium]
MGRRKGKQERLDQTVSVLQTRFGARAIQQGVRASTSVPHLATGFGELDAALGIGGIPRGKITVLAGAATSGKRTLAALLLARAQGPKGRPVAYVDLGQTCDAEYLERCGVDLDAALIARPKDSRQALDLLLSLAERRDWAAVVFDHWSALAEDARTQRYAAAALDQLTARLAQTEGTTIVLDEAPRGIWSRLLGDPARDALGQHAAVRLALRRESWLDLGRDVRGYRVEVKVEKNKLGPAGASVTVEIRFNGVVRGDGI